ncbi:MAG TPA: HEAT repeat domain-containing protein [bacterium]|nr:HEAT repeat domain-containing protein [bacterium]
MNETMKAIVGLLEGGRPELQVAAAQVLGELRPKDAAAVTALAGGIDRSPVLGRFCLESLAKIGSAQALAAVAEAVVEHEVLSDRAAQLLGEVGAPAHGVLAKIYPQAIGEQRARILSVLVRELSKTSLTVFVEALLTPDLTDVAAGLLEAEREQFARQTAKASIGKALREGLAKRLDDEAPPATAARILAMLAVVDARGAKALFLKHTAPEYAPAVRSAAFRALRGSSLTANQVKAMMAALEDADQKDVHDAIRDVLLRVPELPTGLAPSLKRMLTSRQPERRLFAVRMLRTAGGTELAKTFVKLLSHDDERFRQAAAEGLAHNRQAVEPLLKLMQTTRNPDLAALCGDVLHRLSEHLTPKLQKATAEKAVKLLGSNARLGDMLLDLVLHAGGAKIAPFLIEKAVRLRRAHKPAEALHLLAKVAASEHGDDEAHYQIALTKLLAAADEAEAEGGPGNSTMGFFAVLIRGGFPLFDRLRRESAVKPEMLLRLATHFAGNVGAERRFGAEMLQYLAQRTKGRAGDEARLLLRTAGI